MTDVTRRDALKLFVSVGGAAAACTSRPSDEPAPQARALDNGAVVRTELLPSSGSWPTLDPFLFCVHHRDAYPAGNGAFGPAESLAGRQIGQDFANKDGWNMYHGDEVPGFPAHPHRGFETVTVVRRGLLDHADSLGAAARYGEGDTQWLTAGAGIQHAEMFPLLREDRANPLELFQIWLNLPARNKLVPPYFKMLWASQIPLVQAPDKAGNPVEISLRAGRLRVRDMEHAPPAPPPDSWAAAPENELCIWTIKLAPGASWTLPRASAGLNRALYHFRGASLRVADTTSRAGTQLVLRSEHEVELVNGPEESELLLLQARPIAEPVARRGPFVMNTQTELRQAYSDYGATRFGGWPWPDTAPVHGPKPERFARRPDGSIERPT